VLIFTESILVLWMGGYWVVTFGTVKRLLGGVSNSPRVHLGSGAHVALATLCVTDRAGVQPRPQASSCSRTLACNHTAVL